jgi:hypothetical protein
LTRVKVNHNINKKGYNLELKVNRAIEINRLYGEICDELRTTVQKAIRVGELLIEQKAECGHGKWLLWLKANVKFSKSSAENFMNAYKRRNKIPTVGNLSLKEAYGYLKQVAEPEPVIEIEAEAVLEPETTDPVVIEINELHNQVVEANKKLTSETRPVLKKLRDWVLWEHGGKVWDALCWVDLGPPKEINAIIDDPEAVLDRIGWILFKHDSKHFVSMNESEAPTCEEILERVTSEEILRSALEIKKEHEEWLIKEEEELAKEMAEEEEA